MLALTTVALLAGAFPVSLPKQLGHLTVLDSKETARGIEIELEYLNDTTVQLRAVAVECVAFDHRDYLVTSSTETVAPSGKPIAPGGKWRGMVVLADRTGRGRRVECAVARARGAEQIVTPIITPMPPTTTRHRLPLSQSPLPVRKSLRLQPTNQRRCPTNAAECAALARRPAVTSAFLIGPPAPRSAAAPVSKLMFGAPTER